MKRIVGIALSVLLAATVTCSFVTHSNGREETMSATGSFEVNLAFQQDDETPAGRMIIDKAYHGDIEGVGVGQMISKRIENGSAIYFAIEEFSGIVNGKSGAFTLVHKGFMSSESQSLEISILDGSGSGELSNISGSMEITVDGDDHLYELEYVL